MRNALQRSLANPAISTGIVSTTHAVTVRYAATLTSLGSVFHKGIQKPALVNGFVVMKKV